MIACSLAHLRVLTTRPLRGGKYSTLEGGIRVNAFAAGGLLPEKVRGTRQDGVIHIADWCGCSEETCNNFCRTIKP